MIRFPSQTFLPKEFFDEQNLSKKTSSTSTKIEGFDFPSVIRSESSTPLIFEKARPLTPKISETDIKSTSRDPEILQEAKAAARNKNWSRVQEKLYKIKQLSLRDLGYNRTAKIATDIAQVEIQENDKPEFYSPSIIKAYTLAGQILNPDLKKQTFEYIESQIVENEADFGEITSTHDTEFSNLAENAGLQNKWSAALSHIQNIRDPFFRDLACAQLTKIAANAAIDASSNKAEYRNILMKAHGFCQEITDREYQEDTYNLLNNMLNYRKKVL